MLTNFPLVSEHICFVFVCYSRSSTEPKNTMIIELYDEVPFKVKTKY